MEDYRIRIRIFAGVVLAVLALLGGRLVQLQVVSSDTYWGESQSNAVQQQRVTPARGAIYDRSGTLLVDNEPTYTVMLTPRHFDPDRTELLADLLGVSDSLVTQRLEEARSWSSVRPSRSFREVPFEAFSRIQEHLYALPGVTYEIEPRRQYHTDARAAHALGYVREIGSRSLERLRTQGYRQGERVGTSGIERQYEEYLRGTPGHEFKVVNVRGLEVKSYRDGAEDRPPESGYDLHLNLDHEMQALAESLFVNKRGAAIAIDPNNGDVLSLVSKPDYHPGTFARSVRAETWDSLRTDPTRPLFNRATMSGVPPGSVWKPFMSLMALEEGLISANSQLDCPSGYPIGNRVFRNHENKSFGRIDVQKALEVSCNTFYYQLMEDIDVNTWNDWAETFGFGQRAPIDLGSQQPGLVPDSTYFDRMYGRWTLGYTVNLGIGQGDMAVTPLQLARYTGAIANGGTLHPLQIVQSLRHPDNGEEIVPDRPAPEELPIAERHFETVRGGMKRVMEEGTGEWVQIPDIPSAGKTGTAQNPHGENHSVFVMFAPYDDPEIALAVVVENAGYGATAAAPIGSLMAEQYLTGEIADTWQRNWLRERLLEEVESEPLEERAEPERLVEPDVVEVSDP